MCFDETFHDMYKYTVTGLIKIVTRLVTQGSRLFFLNSVCHMVGHNPKGGSFYGTKSGLHVDSQNFKLNRIPKLDSEF